MDNPILDRLQSIKALRQQEVEFEKEIAGGTYDELLDLARTLYQESISKKSDLTAREIDVFRALSLGKSTKQAANELDITDNTVKVHAGSVRRKLSKAVGYRIESTLKMSLVFWGISAKAICEETAKQKAAIVPKIKRPALRLIPK